MIKNLDDSWRLKHIWKIVLRRHDYNLLLAYLTLSSDSRLLTSIVIKHGSIHRKIVTSFMHSACGFFRSEKSENSPEMSIVLKYFIH